MFEKILVNIKKKNDLKTTHELIWTKFTINFDNNLLPNTGINDKDAINGALKYSNSNIKSRTIVKVNLETQIRKIPM